MLFVIRRASLNRAVFILKLRRNLIVQMAKYNQSLVGPIIGAIVMCLIGLRAEPTPRISHGSVAKENHWPFFAFLQMKYDETLYSCGGSIISDEWVLTAAHCVQNEIEGKMLKLEESKVYFGLYDKLRKEDAIKRGVSEIVCHPKYSPNTAEGFSYDLALIKLDRPLDVKSQRILDLIKLDKKGNIGHSKCFIMGFGDINQSEERTNNLQELEMREYDKKLCLQIFTSVAAEESKELLSLVITDRQLCMVAGKSHDPQRPSIGGSCPGDSGGPLVCNHKSGWIQVGVTRGGYDCGERLPTVFHYVYKFKDFIKETVCDSKPTNSKRCLIS